jgi:Rrf2 family protein
MLGISRETDYATRVVLHLACLAPGAQASIAEISLLRHLPVPFVRRMVGRLIKAGILQSSRGARGGVSLARPAAAISLLDVVQATEGPIALNVCVENAGSCLLADSCPAHGAWGVATRVLVKHLASVRFDVLATTEPGHMAAHLATGTH